MIKYKDVMKTQWFNEMEQKWFREKQTTCPICALKLYKRNEGSVCKNSNCFLYFKLAKGWVYLDGNKNNNLNYFKDEYDFSIERFENKKRWLLLKNEVFHERGRKCEICHTEISLGVHHIIYRTQAPSLTFDKENLMVLCRRCHTKIHEEDKHKFNLK